MNCVKCNAMTARSNYSYCADCFKAKAPKCGCGKKIGNPKYKQCYRCSMKKHGRCIQCKKYIVKPPHKICYKCMNINRRLAKNHQVKNYDAAGESS